MSSKFFVIVTISIVVGVLAFSNVTFLYHAFGSVLNFFAVTYQTEVPEPFAILFTGDVMLARNVERMISEHGQSYPFQGLLSLFKTQDVVVVNFEAAAPEKHVLTPNFTFAFSVQKEIVTALSSFGITHASLANNHALDFGVEGYAETSNALEASGITPFGVPKTLQGTTTTYIETDHGKLAIVGIETVSEYPEVEDVHALFNQVNAVSDFQIAYVHWGTEYENKHSAAQEDFARILIAAGADLIIGHHPHVVQDVAIYDGVVVFYSLGNTIFDQYFSEAVQEGLLVSLTVDSKQSFVSLIPITSIGSLSSPRLMSEEEAKLFFESMATSSDAALQSDLQNGRIILGW